MILDHGGTTRWGEPFKELDHLMTHQTANTLAPERLPTELEALASLAVTVLNPHQRRGPVHGVRVSVAMRTRPTCRAQLRAGGIMSCRPNGVGSAQPAVTDCAGSRPTQARSGPRMPATGQPGRQRGLVGRSATTACSRPPQAGTDVYTEDTDVSAPRAGAAFSVLVEALRRPHIYIVITPAPEHSSRFGGMYRAMCTALAVETGADVLIMSQCGEGAQ